MGRGPAVVTGELGSFVRPGPPPAPAQLLEHSKSTVKIERVGAHTCAGPGPSLGSISSDSTLCDTVPQAQLLALALPK